MSTTEIILVAIQVSVALSVFAIGLRATFTDVAYLFRRPSALVRALLSMNVVMPLFAVAAVLAFDLKPAVKIALVALSVSPVPPILPKRALKAGGQADYTLGLLAAMAVLSIVVIPVATELFERVFGLPLEMSPSAVARIVLISVIGPLAAGLIARHIAPVLAERAAAPIAVVAMVFLFVSFLPVLFSARGAIFSLIGDGTLAIFVAFCVVALAAGHFLGGPVLDNRTVLALATASRHPALAVAIAHANFPEEKLAFAAVLLYVLVSLVVSVPYLGWVKRHRAAAVPAR